MRRLSRTLQTIGLYLTAFVLVAGYPMSAMASTQEPTEPQPTTQEAAPPSSEATQTDQPAATQTTTQTTTEPEEPKLTYTYNKETGTWDSEKWVFNPLTGKYEAPPQPVVIEPLTTTEKEPESEISDTTKASLDADIDTNVTLDTKLQSDAVSGDALVFKNTTGGNATSGDAEAVANVLNIVNSTVGTSENQKVAHFTQDVLGDVKGDIILSPLLLKAFLEAQAPDSLKSNIDVNTNMAINNDLTLNATSGSAGVMNNTTGGNATTGSATAVANVVNVLNSMIATQQSFIGTINIYGDLEGDILIAPDFIPQMIASNGGSEADLKVSSEDTQTIVNNISAVAESGAASVFNNTKAGSATSGDADTNVVIFNLSGHEVIAKNSLLVFVNVLGKWVGVIVDAPEGATAAMLSNGVEHSSYQPDLTVASKSSHGITNTIGVNAKTGDATVANNTEAGNAVSGSAKAMANIANVTGSQFSASDWFGVLFINVFSNWYGSFGVNTPYGDTPAVQTPAPAAPIEFRPAAAEVPVQTSTTLSVVDSRAFTPAVALVANAVSEMNKEMSSAPPASLASQSTLSETDERNQMQLTAPGEDYRMAIIAGSLLLIGVSVIGLKRLFS